MTDDELRDWLHDLERSDINRLSDDDLGRNLRSYLSARTVDPPVNHANPLAGYVDGQMRLAATPTLTFG
jgi:hypothetical protein